MNHYELTLILTPVMPEKELKASIKGYMDLIKKEGKIVQEDHWGLKQLAYPIRKKTTGIYHITEFTSGPEFIDQVELALRRDENVLRFHTVRLDKYAKKYNEDRRAGLIGPNRVKTEQPAEETNE